MILIWFPSQNWNIRSWGGKKSFIRIIQAGKLISLDKYWHENACQGKTAAKKQNLGLINVKNYYFLNV